MYRRQIVGIQLHHHVSLQDASRYAANAATALSSVLARTGDPEVQELIEAQVALTRRIGVKGREAHAVFLDFRDRDPEGFARARDGAIPWPDETVGSFTPRCTCNDVCQVHDRGRTEPGWECQCRPCPAHREAA